MTNDKTSTRRRYRADFKAQVLGECDARGASVSKTAMAHEINTNVVHGWRKLAREASGASPVASVGEILLDDRPLQDGRDDPRSAPPQFGQCCMSMSNMRLSSRAQLTRRGRP